MSSLISFSLSLKENLVLVEFKGMERVFKKKQIVFLLLKQLFRTFSVGLELF